nr:chaperone protein DnaJ 49 [Tanacetum cinerariifolium]
MKEYQPLRDLEGDQEMEGGTDLEQDYTNEQVELVSKILTSHNYFDILGIEERTCDLEKIDNAYKKLSKEVNPEKNKASGSDEAFKKVMKAFECLSDQDKHLRYVFMARMHPKEPTACEIVVCSLILLCILFYVAVRFSDSSPFHPYFLEVDNFYDCKSPMMTKEYRIEFYVRSSAEFDEKYPVGANARTDIKNKVIDDYIALRTCDLEKIDNAYKKLSKEVNPEKNKAPGSDEAFKKVTKAFECLSDQDKHLLYVFMARMRPKEPTACEIVVCPLLLLCVLFYAAIGFSDASPTHPYFLEVDNFYDYKSPMMTKEYGIEFYVRSSAEFDEKYPVGTNGRTDIENKVIDDYITLVQKCCSDELRWNLKRREFPTLMCDKIQTLSTHTRT